MKQKIPDEELIKILKEMEKLGFECGEKITEIARKLHPDALAVVKGYRSALVILPPETDCVTVLMYGDPHAWGKEITEETVKDMVCKVEIRGDRMVPNIYLDGNRMIMEKVAKVLCERWGSKAFEEEEE